MLEYYWRYFPFWEVLAVTRLPPCSCVQNTWEILCSNCDLLQYQIFPDVLAYIYKCLICRISQFQKVRESSCVVGLDMNCIDWFLFCKRTRWRSSPLGVLGYLYAISFLLLTISPLSRYPCNWLPNLPLRHLSVLLSEAWPELDTSHWSMLGFLSTTAVPQCLIV